MHLPWRFVVKVASRHAIRQAHLVSCFPITFQHAGVASHAYVSFLITMKQSSSGLELQIGGVRGFLREESGLLL